MERVLSILRSALAILLAAIFSCSQLCAVGFPAVEPAKDSEAQKDRDLVVRGRVVLADGTPGAGARLTFTGRILVAGDNRRRSQAIVNGAATTCDKDGYFRYAFSGPVSQVTATVNARGTFGNQIFKLMSNAMDNEIRLLAGSQVRGRVMKDARSAGGTYVVLAEVFATDKPTRSYEAVTDSQGRFVIEHAPPDADFRLFSPMEPLAEQNLAAIRQVVRTGREGQISDLPEVNLHPANIIRGKIVGLNNYEEMSVVIARVDVGDKQSVPVESDGTFVLYGVPRERVILLVETRGKPEWCYLLSGANQSLDHADMTQLCGRVDHDLDLTVRLSGSRTVKAPRLQADSAALQFAQPRIVVARMMVNGQPQNVQRVVFANGAQELKSRMQQLLDQPLRGVVEWRERDDEAATPR